MSVLEVQPWPCFVRTDGNGNVHVVCNDPEFGDIEVCLVSLPGTIEERQIKGNRIAAALNEQYDRHLMYRRPLK